MREAVDHVDGKSRKDCSIAMRWILPFFLSQTIIAAYLLRLILLTGTTTANIITQQEGFLANVSRERGSYRNTSSSFSPSSFSSNTSSSSLNTLSLSSSAAAKKSSSSSYSSSASSSSSSSSSSLIALDLDSAPSHVHLIRRRSVRKSANVGGSVILECDVNYPGGQYTEHIIKWHKQGIEVPIYIQLNRLPSHIDVNYQKRLRLVDQAASIEISQLQVKDEGWYECSVVFMKVDDINPNGTWVYLSVTAPPVLTSNSPGLLIRKEGASVDMFCTATGIPQPAVTWLREGRELTSQGRLSISGTRVHVKHLEKSDAGLYTCLFKNSVAQISHTIRLIIEQHAYIMVPPKNTTQIEGSRVRLTCQAEAYPNNITYQWFRDDVDVYLVTGLMTRAGVHANGDFVISSVHREDTGWFKCQPNNGLGKPPTAQAFLNVTYYPRVQGPWPTTVYLPLGLQGRVDCPAEANPPVTRTVWSRHDQPQFTLHYQGDEKDDEEEEYEEEKEDETEEEEDENEEYEEAGGRERERGGVRPPVHRKVTRHGTLLFRTVVPSDAGHYSCTPESPLGKGHTSPLVSVLVKDPPYFTIRPRPVYQRHPTQSVLMPCAAEAEPKPSISWRKVDGSFPSRSKLLQSGGNLTITDLSKDDQGVYECVASNIVTNVITSSLLIIELSPRHDPYNVTVRTTSTSAKVFWLPAYDQGYPQHYVLWYRMIGEETDGQWLTIRIVPDDVTSITIYNLQPDTTYQFMVLSRNRQGDEQFSAPFTATTQENEYEEPTDPPEYMRPSPPLNVTVRHQKEGLHISWLEPKNSPVPIKYYQIEYKTVGLWVPLNDRVEKPYYTWKTASYGATYQFKVVSYSASSVASESSPVFTLMSRDPMITQPMSDGLFRGAVAGLVLALVAVVLIVVIVRICQTRQRRRRSNGRYGDVKYFGPNQVEMIAQNRNGDRGQICSVVESEPEPMIENHITTFTNHRENKVIQETPI